MPLLPGTIADDFTGATDLANTLVREGMRTVQLIGVPGDDTETGEADGNKPLPAKWLAPPGGNAGK